MLKIRVNPDKEIVKMVTDYLREHDGECPCQLDAICKCDRFKNMNEEGFCHCIMFETYDSEKYYEL